MIETNLHHIQEQIRACEARYHRVPDSVQLLAASKGQSVTKMLEVYQLGLRDFGENYVQEALAKMALLAQDNIVWHFIGPIQSNKTKKIAEHFSWVHSVANKKTAERLHAQRPAHLPPLNICIEVNISHEASKSGVDEAALLDLAAYCQHLPQLKLRGLMAIPAPTADVTLQRAAFHRVWQLLQHLREAGIALDTLSMGMSADFEAAIAEGATLVRIGTALFGQR